VYASVKNIPDALSRIETSGGRTVMPRTDVGPVVMALFQDPEGNTMGLVEAR
jgi:predicted enzyme related to lactoylglutathione lyase